MSNIDDQINLIKARIHSAHLSKAKNEALKESASEARDRAIAELEAKFGLDNLGDVHAKLAELQDQLDSQIAKINETLNDLNI